MKKLQTDIIFRFDGTKYSNNEYRWEDVVCVPYTGDRIEVGFSLFAQDEPLVKEYQDEEMYVLKRDYILFKSNNLMEIHYSLYEEKHFEQFVKPYLCHLK